MCREMKDSGIEWIGEINNEWSVVKIAKLAQFINGYAFNGEDLTIENEIPVIRIGDIQEGGVNLEGCLKYKKDKRLYNYSIQSKDVLIAMSGATTGKTAFINEVDSVAYINQRVGIIRNSKYSKYINYSLNTGEFKKYIDLLADGSAQPNISTKGIMNYYLALPNRGLDNIINYLDRKVSQINNVISKQKILIEKYKDYKQSIITETVTKGLNKNVPMKDSGIEWNREIPVHWNVIQSKNLFSQRKDRAKEGERQLTASQKYGVIYQDEYMKLENQKVVTVDKGADILKQVEPNDFVISMRSFQGGLEYSSLSGSISSAYVMLIPNKKVYPPYFRWLFKSIKYINALQSTSNLVRDGQAMRYSNFKQIPLFEIPIEEQQEIAEFLDNRCKSIDSVISKKEQLIEKLESYKKSLIYECVTGKRVVN